MLPPFLLHSRRDHKKLSLFFNDSWVCKIVLFLLSWNLCQKSLALNQIFISKHVMECYATPWRLWRKSRILWHIVELSFAFEGLPLSLSPSLICLSFLFWRRVYWIIWCCVLFIVLLERGWGKKISLKTCFLYFFVFKSDFCYCQKL